MWAFNREGIILFANDEMAELMLDGLTANSDQKPVGEDLVGRSYLEFIPDRVRPASMAWLAGWDLPTGVATELPMRTNAGRPIVVMATVTTLDNEVAVGVLHDITEQRETEHRLIRALAESERITEERRGVLANVSHELRTPLHALLGYADLLEDMVPEQGKEYIAAMTSAAHLLRSLIDDVMDATTPLGQEIPTSRSPVDPSEVMEECAALVRTQAGQRGVTVEVQSEIRRGVLITDRRRLVQIMLNFLSNAAKFTPRNSTIYLSASNVPDPASAGLEAGRSHVGMLRFSVRDEGPGLRDVEVERMFEPFTRGTTGVMAAGSGLGLSVARTLAAALGGSVGARGNTFWLDLPLTPPGAWGIY